MNQATKKEHEYLISCIQRNSEEIINKKPSEAQLVALIKQKGWAIWNGDTSAQTVVDLCSAIVSYKIVLKSK